MTQIGKRIVGGIDILLHTLVMASYVFFLIFGAYSIWDKGQVSAVAHSNNYKAYKPSGGSSLSFEELTEINTDVFGWITIYGTGIDYPVVQGKDNDTYVSTNTEGNYAMSGSIFLDYRNSDSFDDFNSIFYGHHMAESAMFGDLGNFSQDDYFQSRKYGNLYFNGRDHGLEIFAFLAVDASDMRFFTPALFNQESKIAFLHNIEQFSVYFRDIDATIDDHYIVLTTCTSSSTNGRHILIARLTDDVFDVPEAFQEASGGSKMQIGALISDLNLFGDIPRFVVISIFIYVLILVLLTSYVMFKKNKG